MCDSGSHVRCVKDLGRFSYSPMQLSFGIMDLKATDPGKSRQHGVILVDKSAGVTSFDVVAKVRRELGRKAKVGHSGTLDPFATGLLLILVGRATRVQRFLMVLPKRYVVTARLGWTSATGDPEGEIERGRMPVEPLVLPTGVVRQRPPAFSAVKVRGQRAYMLARKGESVELKERDVLVTRFEQLWREGEYAGFVIECSSGTYVRSLISDLGDAYCTELRRERIGDFDVADADPDRLISVDDALAFMPELELSADEVVAVSHGRVLVRGVLDEPVGGDGGSVIRLTDERGLVALAERRGVGKLRPILVWRE